jgi:hypothetical protein
LGRVAKVVLAVGLTVGNVAVVILAVARFAEGDVIVGLGWLIAGAGAVALLSVAAATVVETVVSRGR